MSRWEPPVRPTGRSLEPREPPLRTQPTALKASACSFTYPPDTSRKVKAKLKVKSLFTSWIPFSAARQTACDLYSPAFERGRPAPRGSGHGDLAPRCHLPPLLGLGREGARRAHPLHLRACFPLCFILLSSESWPPSLSQMEQ